MTTAAVMQPTYLGWCGYFALLDRADVFVLLDTVQLDSRSWQVRNRIRTRDNQVVWLTVPVHAHRGDLISDVRIDNTQAWQRKHWRTIEAAYSHAPYWDDIADILAGHYDGAIEWTWLAVLTSSLIIDIAIYLEIDTPIRIAHALPDTSGDRVERLADLCRHAGADTLIEPTGGVYLHGRDRLADDIGLEWHEYQHPVYNQDGQLFQPYLSVIDLIAWHGRDSLTIIRNRQKVTA